MRPQLIYYCTETRVYSMRIARYVSVQLSVRQKLIGSPGIQCRVYTIQYDDSDTQWCGLMRVQLQQLRQRIT